MVYNKKILADAGVTEIPKTWDEFVVAAQKTTDPSKEIWGTSSDVANVSNMTTWEWILIRQYGGDFFDDRPGRRARTLPQNVQAMKFFLDWIGKDKIMSPKTAQYNASQAEEDFNNGKVAFLFTQGKPADHGPVGVRCRASCRCGRPARRRTKRSCRISPART